MKSFYSYNTRENRQILTVLTVTLAVCCIVSLGALIIAVSKFGSNLPIALLYLLVAIILAPIAYTAFTAKRDLEYKFKNENIIAHDWGVEFELEGHKRQAKWENIATLSTEGKRILFLTQKEHFIHTLDKNTLSFYSSLENSEFLVNYIQKNLRKKGEDNFKMTYH